MYAYFDEISKFLFQFNLRDTHLKGNIYIYMSVWVCVCRAGRSDTGVGSSDTPTLSEVGGKSVASRGVGSPVLCSDTTSLLEK